MSKVIFDLDTELDILNPSASSHTSHKTKTSTTTTTTSDIPMRSLTLTLTLAIAAAAVAVSAYTTVSFYFSKKKSRDLKSKIEELEKSLETATQKCTAERQGRIRAQQALRKALTETKSDNEKTSPTCYPMKPIGTVQSCFSTRNGTPRQPLVVPLARACLVFDPACVPPASLEGFEDYSHCWIIYVFHLNTDLEKLWMKTSQSKFKAKVRVPRLKGGRVGVFATRSPHRPCPIGLTVAKVEAVKGHMILLSGVDLVDGTPVLDIKPYLPYCDSIPNATLPKWVMEDDLLMVNSVSFSDDFCLSLRASWAKMEKSSLYASPDEIKSLIKQVLAWDIRSVSQRNKPHESSNTSGINSISNADTLNIGDNEANGNGKVFDTSDVRDNEANGTYCGRSELNSSDGVIYHLNLEGLDISYRIDCKGNVTVNKATASSALEKNIRNCCNYSMWKDRLEL